MTDYLMRSFDIQNSAFFFTIILTLGVVFVNGWTDAPNAIATAVATRAISPKKAVIMSAVFNFLGIIIMTALNRMVALTVAGIADFGNTGDASAALCGALVSVIIWAVLAWAFGLPTSESHAIIAGLTGAAIAVGGGANAINVSEWIKVIYGLIMSLLPGGVIGFIITRIIILFLKNCDRRKTIGFFNKAQIAGSAAMSFMHGAQDGQKFIGVLLLGMMLANGENAPNEFAIPLSLLAICSIVMSLGTLAGGYRIIKTVGMDMAKLEGYQAFSADLASAVCLFICSVFGIPVSTTHTKTAAIVGTGAAKNFKSVNFGVMGNMIFAWIMTFPCCTLIGYIAAKVFMSIF